MTRYVTLAYGDSPAIYRQSLMLLVSLAAFAPDPYELIVATERPECYVWFGTRVEIIFLDAARLTAWRGAEPFSMRQKLELLLFVHAESGRTSADGPLVLLDADVLAMRPLTAFVERLHAGDLFMHKREFVLSRNTRRGNRKLWTDLQRIERGRAVAERVFGASSEMWNSGVLGVGANDGLLVRNALQLYDRLASAGLRHFATEQLVESAVFGATGRLRAADAWFAHYWGNKDGYDAEIARRLADAFVDGSSVAAAAARYRERPIDLPAEVRPTPRQKAARWFVSRRSEG